MFDIHNKFVKLHGGQEAKPNLYTTVIKQSTEVGSDEEVEDDRKN